MLLIQRKLRTVFYLANIISDSQIAVHSLYSREFFDGEKKNNNSKHSKFLLANDSILMPLLLLLPQFFLSFFLCEMSFLVRIFSCALLKAAMLIEYPLNWSVMLAFLVLHNIIKHLSGISMKKAVFF